MTIKKLKLAFVISWFGKDIGGGAEAECYALIQGLKKFYPELEIEVLTSTLKEFSADWNERFHKEGVSVEDGIRVRRFDAKPVDREDFHSLNLFRLMPQQVDDLTLRNTNISPLTKKEERLYADAMINVPGLIQYIKQHQREYDFFIFIPYMFGTSFRGIPAAKSKAVIIPCLHNERYAYMDLYKKMMRNVRASIFHVQAEQNLANKLYQMKGPQLLLGEMVDVSPPRGDAARFRQKYHIPSPFILYAGRKITGKNLPSLVNIFLSAKNKNKLPADLKLVIIGGGDLTYPKEKFTDVVDLGFVPKGDKYDAYAAALCLCQPSLNESFSIVMMEAWLQKIPVLVNAACEVTSEHITRCCGGLTYTTTDDFSEAINKFFASKEKSQAMAQRGFEYVQSHFSPEMITKRFVGFLNNISD